MDFYYDESMRDFSLSILLPVHSTRFLNNTLKSIYTSQGVTDSWELIVVLDRISVAEFTAVNPVSYQKMEVLVFISDSPGIVSALNLGIDKCRGRFIARIDEDDLVSPGRFKSQMRYLVNHPNTVAVGGSLELINANGDRIGFKTYPIFNRGIRRRIYDQSPIPHPGSMYLSEAARNIGGYRYGVPEDWDLWLRMSKLGKLHNLNRVVISYRQHQGQLSREKFYNSKNARNLIYLADRFNWENFLEFADNPELASLYLDNPPKEINKDQQYKRLRKYTKFENLRFANVGHQKFILIYRYLVILWRYPGFSVSEFYLRIRSYYLHFSTMGRKRNPESM